MAATLVVRHKVNDHANWRSVYDRLEPLCAGWILVSRQM
jgi:hypothetical protein